MGYEDKRAYAYSIIRAMAQLPSSFCTLLLLGLASFFPSIPALSVSFLPTRRLTSRSRTIIPLVASKSTVSSSSSRVLLYGTGSDQVNESGQGRDMIDKSGIMATGSEDDVTSVVGQMRGGLTFVKTRDRLGIVEFYRSQIGMEIWLEQPDITILSFGNFLIGFHHKVHEEPDLAGMYTFVYPTIEAVDDMYETFKATTADGPPRVNPTYRIYQFFASDPEGRKLEFQAFLHPLDVVSSAVLEGF